MDKLLNMSAHDPSFAGEFAKVCRGETAIDLPGLMLEIAADADPHLDLAACRMELSRLCDDARSYLAELGPDASTVEKLEALSRFLCEDEGFGGNEEDYYDPRNSYLHEVLSRRTGVPISLCLLYAHVGRTCGLPLEGVNAPAHFMLRCPSERGVVFVDVFHAGDVLDARACRERIEQLLGLDEPLPAECLLPASLRDITARLLRNLKASHVASSDWESALPVQQRLAALLPEVPCESRDLGLISLRAGRASAAFSHLTNYCLRCPPQERQELEPFVLAAQRQLAEWN